MARTFKLCLAAVAILAAGSLASLAMASGAAAQPVATAPVPVEAPAPQASAPIAPASLPVAAPAAPTAPAPQQPERDDFKNWSSETAKLPKDLGEMGPSLKLGLDDAHNKDMAFCFRELEDGGNRSRATDFVLYLEAREDAVDVVEAKVARPGALPPSVVECARDVLRGLEVKVFLATPGQRFSYIYEVEA